MEYWRDQTREKRHKTGPSEERSQNRERMDVRRSQGRDEERHMIETREERREERERIEILRSRGRDEQQRPEPSDYRRYKQQRSEDLRDLITERRQRTYDMFGISSDERTERMEILRSRGREEKQRREFSGNRTEKRQRSEELSGSFREKRQRTEDHREDERRHWAELDAGKSRDERIQVREQRTENRERLEQTPTESPTERPKSISHLNRIYGGLREGKDEVGRRRTFECMEEVNGRMKNILQGLELHSEVFDPHEQEKITNFVYGLQRLGQEGRLERHTYSAPKKWMRGKGRVTIQFGCCYNYAKDKEGNPPGILRNAQVDQMPPLLKDMISRMVRLRILPATCVPDSCIINIYDEGDCIPPHIDHRDFLRPFCTVSFLSEANIVFGQSLKVAGPGEFTGSASIPLPCGSVLVLSGNGADVAKHSVPAVRSKRISITFRKMDNSKLA